ncbi:MAG: hypothetical protein ACREPI_07420 [Candidatus Dormibacterales bacterium]
MRAIERGEAAPNTGGVLAASVRTSTSPRLELAPTAAGLARQAAAARPAGGRLGMVGRMSIRRSQRRRAHARAVLETALWVAGSIAIVAVVAGGALGLR